jgi:hypothetical protein
MSWRRIRSVELQLHSFITSALHGGKSLFGRFYLRGKTPGTKWLGRWVAPTLLKVWHLKGNVWSTLLKWVLWDSPYPIIINVNLLQKQIYCCRYNDVVTKLIAFYLLFTTLVFKLLCKWSHLNATSSQVKKWSVALRCADVRVGSCEPAEEARVSITEAGFWSGGGDV